MGKYPLHFVSDVAGYMRKRIAFDGIALNIHFYKFLHIFIIHTSQLSNQKTNRKVLGDLCSSACRTICSLALQVHRYLPVDYHINNNMEKHFFFALH